MTKEKYQENIQQLSMDLWVKEHQTAGHNTSTLRLDRTQQGHPSGVRTCLSSCNCVEVFVCRSVTDAGCVCNKKLELVHYSEGFCLRPRIIAISYTNTRIPAKRQIRSRLWVSQECKQEQLQVNTVKCKCAQVISFMLTQKTDHHCGFYRNAKTYTKQLQIAQVNKNINLLSLSSSALRWENKPAYILSPHFHF